MKRNKNLFDIYGKRAYFMLLSFIGFLMIWITIVGKYIGDLIESRYECLNINVWGCGLNLIPILIICFAFLCSGLWICLTLCIPLLKRWEDENKILRNSSPPVRTQSSHNHSHQQTPVSHTHTEKVKGRKVSEKVVGSRIGENRLPDADGNSIKMLPLTEVKGNC